ncbi:hypothetical protein K432DRAFT_38999 [Lepidopterella palustris CBS 459.81]|uniref:Inner centromere protein ARK-binding domain-containing protein n=1 Tax=Lepidopterella palustris CBS 459.81 TaxID=1314670 RepID=A0A8E2EBB5_9PEZI|nr:hypothetical protein K432DRAFT_38999 [Lepidopterella palustris CBS 459.81]
MEPWQSWLGFLGLIAGFYLLQSRGKTNNKPENKLDNKPDTKARHKSRPFQNADDKAGLEWQKPSHKADGEGPRKAAGKPSKLNRQRKASKTAKGPMEKVEATLSANSSTTGADGDDDLSPAVSPALSANNGKAPSGKDVSDMLETRAGAPAVLRLTEPSQPVRQKQVHQARPEAAQETKKQRQNRKKVEERKLQREQEEKERQVLLEKQRRTAREARGEPAKNGLQPAKAPASSAWNLAHHTSNVAVGSSNDGQLLDTFEQDGVSTTSSSENATNGTSATTDSMNNSGQWAGMPSEEEQLRMAMADSEWTTVSKGRKAKKNKTSSATEEATGTEGSDAGTPQQQDLPGKKTVPEAETPTAPPNASYSTSNEAAAHFTGTHPMDSDWPVV